ncbi:MAG: dihydropteroate synthase [Actinomycetota bacterium]|nr:dihydropteroate synthase [Actinomycetota bacterium]
MGSDMGLGVGEVMGVLNVTPDSFSDGGEFLDYVAAVAHGRRLLDEGASILDVGGESTRPGAAPVGDVEEVARVVPVIEALADEPEVASGAVRISVDTRHASVARAAVAAGATIVNDVSAGLSDVAAELGVGWVAMHMQGDPRTMQDEPVYDDVVAEVRDFLVDRAQRATAVGVPEVWIDPGIGFGKTAAHNLLLVRWLDRLVDTGFPVVLGVSRKRFLGEITGLSDRSTPGEVTDGGVPTPPGDRREASVALAAWGYRQGVAVVRAHDVRATVRAARVVGGG